MQGLEWVINENSPRIYSGDKGHLKIRKRFNGFVRFAGLRLLPNPAYII